MFFRSAYAKLFSFLLILALCAAALPAGALEITELPATFAELQALLPEMPDMTPEGLAFYIPTYDEIMSKSRSYEFICDKEKWVARIDRLADGKGLEFVYDDAAGAYIVEERFRQVSSFSMMTGMLDGTLTIASTEEVNGWTLFVGLYFDNAFSESVVFREDDITEATWLNVAGAGDTNYFMPNVIAQYTLDNGYLQIWRYATKTIAVIRDAKGETLVSQTYPESSEWCNTFMPTFQ